MKKILFLLLLSVTVYGQVPADATPLENVQITNNVVSTGAPSVVVQETNGVMNKINKGDVIEYLEFASAVNLPVTGVSGKLYLTRDNNRLYRWNGTIYVEVTADISGKEDVDNKSSSFTVSSTTTYANTKALVDGLVTVYGQVPADATPLENVQITNNVVSTGAPSVVVQETNGVMNKINKGDVIEYLEFASAVNLPVTGVSGKLYLTRDNNRLYRWNGTIYVEVTADISGKEDVDNKSSSFTVSSTTTYANTKALVDGLATKQDKPIYVSSNIVAQLNQYYIVTADSVEITPPSVANVGDSYIVYVLAENVKLCSDCFYNYGKLVYVSRVVGGWNINPINNDIDISGKEDVSNKSQTLTASSTLYPSNNAVIAGLNNSIKQSDIKFNFIQKNLKNPILSASTSGWDTKFRELGNVIKVGNLYVMVYSGFTGAYTETSAVYCGIATSTDGVNWVKGGVNNDGLAYTDVFNEDNYIVYNSGTYYIYSENKSTIPQTISLHTSTDLINFTNVGNVLTNSASGFDRGDVCSPTVFIENGVWKMIYEGRDFTGAVVDNGQIGIATSTDGINWTKSPPPIISNILTNGFWADQSIVPDDIFKIGDTYYLSYHGRALNMDIYRGGMAYSQDLVNWRDYFGYPILKDGANSQDNMFFFDGGLDVIYYSTNRESILRGKLTNKPLQDYYKSGNFLDVNTGNVYGGGTNGLTNSAKAISIKNPKGGVYKNPNATATGAIKITLPDASGSFYTIKGTISDYKNGNSQQFLIACYPADLTSPATAVIYGKNDYTVRFYTNGTTPNIYIGETSSSWDFLGISIDEVLITHDGVNVDTQSKNWNIDVVNSFVGTLAKTITDTSLGLNYWTKTGSDIENNNNGDVIIKKALKLTRNDGGNTLLISNGVDTDLLVNTTPVGAGTKYVGFSSTVPNRAIVLNEGNNGNIGIGKIPTERLDVNGNVKADMFIGGAELTGTPTAPTATAGTNTTQIANTLFVNSAITTADSGNVKLAGAQTITGQKTLISPIINNQLNLFGGGSGSGIISFIGTPDTSFTQTGVARIGSFMAFIGSGGSSKKPLLFDGSLLNTVSRTVRFQDTDGTVALTSNLTYTNQTITANKTVTIAEFVNNNELILSVNATSGNITITLPTFTALQGYKVTVKKMDSSANSVLITGVGGVNIDGSSSVIISGQYSSSTIGANLTQYIIL